MKLGILAACALQLVHVACGGASQGKSTATPANAAPVQTTASHVPGRLMRSDVELTVSRGLGAFLGHVQFDDEPEFRDGAFYGFRIRAMSKATGWAGIDLGPGDVIAKINGLPIERPEQAIIAFRSASHAKEILVEGERKGAPLSVRIPIVDDKPATSP